MQNTIPNQLERLDRLWKFPFERRKIEMFKVFFESTNSIYDEKLLNVIDVCFWCYFQVIFVVAVIFACASAMPTQFIDPVYSGLSQTSVNNAGGVGSINRPGIASSTYSTGGRSSGGGDYPGGATYGSGNTGTVGGGRGIGRPGGIRRDF